MSNLLPSNCGEFFHKRKFETSLSLGGMLSGAFAGARFGAGIGIVAGPLGGLAGTIPCAVVGGMIGGLGANKIGTEIDRNKTTT